MSKLRIDSCDLKNMLAGKIRLSVPWFQREYDWEREHCQALWDDIAHHDEHFVGAVVLHKLGGGAAFDIIDGQQRLTSLSLMALACVRKLESESDPRAEEVAEAFLLNGGDLRKKPDLKLALWEDAETGGGNNNAFWRLLAGGLSPRASNEGQEKMRRAYALFSELFSEMGRDAAADFMSRRAGEQLAFARIVTRDSVNAHIVFETLNGRGKALKPADLVKSFLLSAVPEASRKANIALWNGIVKAVGKREMERFLRAVYNAQNRPPASDSELHNKIVSLVDGGTTAQVYLRELREKGDFYRALREPGERRDPDGPWPRRADWRRARFFRDLGLRQIYPALMSARDKFGADEFSRVMRICEVVAFRRITIGGLDASPLAAACNDAACGIFRGEIKGAAELREELRELCPGDRAFALAFAEKEFPQSGQEQARRILLHMLSEMERTESGAEPRRVLARDVASLSSAERWRREGGVAQLAHRVGNFALLENWTGAGEEGDPDPARLSRSEHSLTREAGERWPNFTPADLEERQKRLADLAVKTWSLEGDDF